MSLVTWNGKLLLTNGKLTLPIPFRSGQSPINAPVVSIYSLHNDTSRKAKLFSPYTYRKRFAVVAKKMICSPVSALLFISRPLAISWLVVAIIITSVNFKPAIVSAGHCPFIKHLKGIPLGTDGNAPASVIFEFLIELVIAPSSHSDPDFIDASLRESMRPETIPSLLIIQTSTGPCTSTDKMPKICGDLFSALANAIEPAVRTVFVSKVLGFFDNSKSSEFLAKGYNALTGHDVAPECYGLKKRRRATNTPSFRTIATFCSGDK